MWHELELLIKAKNLNGLYPPARGGYDFKTTSLKKGDIFDRYQEGNFGTELTNGIDFPTCAGPFTSPIRGVPYPYDLRSLKVDEVNNSLYYTIELLEDLPFSGTEATITPWFNKSGKGIQIEFDLPKALGSTRSISWNELARLGLAKITIKSSPNGAFSTFVGKSVN